MPDHVHMLISVPRKYSVAEVIRYLKGKSSIWIAPECGTQAAEFSGSQILGHGYFVGTVRRNEEMIRAYIRNQNQEIADKSWISW